MALPRLATISSNASNCLLSVVSLYGTHNANVRKSNIDESTNAPLPKFTCSIQVFNKLSRNCFDDSNDDLFSCSCLRLKSPLEECINEFNISMAAYVTARSFLCNDATTFFPIDSRNLSNQTTFIVIFPFVDFCRLDKNVLINSTHPCRFVNAPKPTLLANKRLSAWKLASSS